MKRIVYIQAGVTDAETYEWMVDAFDKEKFKIEFIFLNPGSTVLEQNLREKGVGVTVIPFKSLKKSPLAFFKLLKLLWKKKPDIIHCHLFEASLLGLLAAKICGVKVRIYTRHYGDYLHKYYPGSVKYDKLCNRLATKIVATNNNVFNILTNTENVNPRKIAIINYGFKLEKFSNPSPQIVASLQNSYNPNKRGPVIGLIARYDEYKGIEYAVAAFKKILIKYPHAYFIHANARGAYQPAIDAILSLSKETYCSIPFERNIFELYALFDVFIHVPVDSTVEAFGQIYVEALAAGIPGVFTLSGIAPEFIRHRENAMVVDYRNENEIFDAIQLLLDNPTLRDSIVAKGRKDVMERFDLKPMIANLEYLYS